ncbi:MAG: fibronectin type III domain-containing protein [Planctomycetia bacterium]|nr:fibronectin type III domain-containing protein [Planctomycetia bacterium]
MTFKFNSKSNSMLSLKRSLRLEALETRQMLSALGLTSQEPLNDDNASDTVVVSATSANMSDIWNIIQNQENNNNGSSNTGDVTDSSNTTDTTTPVETTTPDGALRAWEILNDIYGITDDSTDTDSTVGDTTGATDAEISEGALRAWEVLNQIYNIDGTAGNTGDSTDSTTGNVTDNTTTDSTQDGALRAWEILNQIYNIDGSNTGEAGDSTTTTPTTNATPEEIKTGAEAAWDILDKIYGTGNNGNTGDTSTDNDTAGDTTTDTTPEAPADAVLNPLVVTTLDDITNEDDGEISLREALANAENGDVITFKNGLQGFIQISESLQTNFNNVTIQGPISLQLSTTANSAPVMLNNLTLDGVQVTAIGDGYVTITNCDFTGVYTNVSSIINNDGANLTVSDTDFTGLVITVATTLNQEAEMILNGCECHDFSNFQFNIIENNGTMTVYHVNMTKNVMTATTSRVNNAATMTGIFNGLGASLAIDSFLFANNDLNATTNRGDVSATLYGIQNFSILNGYNVMMFGNKADGSYTANFEGMIAEAAVFGISTSVFDVELTNATMLEAFQSYRADFYMYNSIYSEEGNDIQRGYVLNEGNNFLVTTDTDLKAIFPAYDAATNTFADYDFRMYIDSEIVDAGYNDFISNIPEDLVGNDRINNETVEIGAVESDAEKLTIDGLVATPEGTDTAILTWNATENSTGYVLRYYTGKEAKETIADGEWVETVVDGLEDLKHIVDSLEARTWVAFQVKALGDNLSYIDSDWSATASCWTKSPFPAPTPFLASLEKPLSIDLSWELVEGAEKYTIEYCKKPESGMPAEEDWLSLPGPYSLGQYYGALRVSNEGGENYLEHSTLYIFRIKADACGDFVDSEYSYAEKCTGAKLVAPALNVGYRTDTTITLTWNDTANLPSQVKNYKLQYRPKAAESAEAGKWIDLGTVPVGSMEMVVSGLTKATEYEFQIMVEGKKVHNSPEQMAEDSDWSETFTVSTKDKLSAPEPMGEGTSATTITVTWNAVEKATSYTVVVKDAEGNVVNTKEDITETTCDFDGLTPDTSYTIEVYAQDGEDFMDSDAGYADAQTWIKLDIPVLTLEDRTTSTVTIDWDEVDGATSYEVKFRYFNNGVWTEWAEWNKWEGEATYETRYHEDGSWYMASIKATETDLTFVEDGEEIIDIAEFRNVQFVIRAIGEEGVSESSDWSEPFQSSTLGQLVIDANSLGAQGDSTSSISASWAAVENATGYVLEYRPAGNANGTWSTANVVIDGVTATITGLNQDTGYELRLTAKGNDTEFVDSTPVTTTATTWYQLVAPMLNGALTITTNSISGTFSAVKYAESYDVEYTLDGGETWLDAMVTDQTFTIDNLESGATVQIRMMSVGTAPNMSTIHEKVTVSSDWSDNAINAVVLTKLETPVITATDVTSNSATVTWNAIEGAESYLLIVKDADGKEVFKGEVTETSKALELSPNRTYTATVQALNSGENFINSEVSEPYTITTPQGKLADITLEAEYDGMDNAIDVTWNEVAGAMGYTLTITYINAEGNEVSYSEPLEFEADETNFKLEDVAPETTYFFQITANADEDNIPSESEKVSVTTPIQVIISAVILDAPSDKAATTVPETKDWVDEWTKVYMEIWGDKSEGLVDGRTFQFSTEFADMYTALPPTVAKGLKLEKIAGTNEWKLTVEEGYEVTSGADMLVRIELVVNTANGVNWTDRVKEDAYKFNGEYIDTDVYATPGDMNDDGTIKMGQNDADDPKFDAELGKTDSWADFNHDGVVNLYDRQWMIDNNYNKTWNGEDDIIYPENAVTPFKFSPVNITSTNKNNSVVPSTPETQEMPEPVSRDNNYDDKDETSETPVVAPEADPIPVVKDENAMTGNGVTTESETEAPQARIMNAMDYVFNMYGNDEDFLA